MPHELAGMMQHYQQHEPGIHATYLKTDVDADDWDRAVLGFTAYQRQPGPFASHRVLGGPDLAKKIIDVVQRHEAEILRACGFAPTVKD
jgi:hypothetical protein